MKIKEIKEDVAIVEIDSKTLLQIASSLGISIDEKSTRTISQNSSIHLMFTQTANALNDAGYSVNTVLNRRKLEIINKVFDWGINKIMKILCFDEITDNEVFKIINKMKERIIKSEEIELTWNTNLVKNVLWRPLQMHETQKESTTKLNKKEIDKVYELFNMVLSRYGIHIPFPSRELWEEKKD